MAAPFFLLTKRKGTKRIQTCKLISRILSLQEAVASTDPFKMTIPWTTMLHPHYVLNIVLTLAFYFLKVSPLVCEKFFPNAEKQCLIEWREYEILAFAAVVIIFKTKKIPSWVGYMKTTCFIGKIANLVLFWRQDIKLAIVFGILCLIHLVCFPQPAYGGAEKVVTIRPGFLEEELERSSRQQTWLVLFYNPWSPLSQQFMPIYSVLAARFSLPNLKFGKVDAVKYEDIAKKYKIDTGVTSRQLPTVVMFRGSQEVKRRPHVDSKCRVQRYAFFESNVVADFDLANIHHELRQSAAASRNGSVDDGPTAENVSTAPEPADKPSGFRAYADAEADRKSNRIMMDRFAKVDEPGPKKSLLTRAVEPVILDESLKLEANGHAKTE